MSVSTSALAPVWTHLTHIQPVRGQGCYLYDAAENAYLDFTCGIGVTNTGHCHPKVVAAIQAQAANLLFGQMNVVTVPQVAELALQLQSLTPPSIEQFFFSNSGAEAVEGSIKLARQATKRRNIIVFQGSFHGRTHLAMAMTTSKYAYRYDYQPLPAGIFVAPYPYAYYYGWDEQQTIAFCLQQLDLLFKSQSAPSETAAIVIEPVLGEGGYVPAPTPFLQALRELCDQHGILLIFDEIQTGFGRTGKFLACEHSGIQPDILILAKGLGSGMPISAIGASRELMARWQPGTHGGTYGGGNAVTAAAALATIQALREEQLVENAAALGAVLQTKLRTLQMQYPVIGDVRGLGLMIATEFTDPYTHKPDSARCKAVAKACLAQNLLLLTCGTYENVIRWIPPLVVSEAEISQALAAFERALGDVHHA
jgi:4-aminobutyrate aminotransferase